MLPMLFFSRGKNLKRCRATGSPSSYRPVPGLGRSRSFERLEERRLLTTLLVNNPTDTEVAGEISLRDAVAQANLDAAAGTSDTITFDPGLGGKTITLAQGQLELSGKATSTITIDGSSPSTPLTINGGGIARIFQIDSGVNVVLTNLNLQDGTNYAATSGGAILNSGTLTISNSTLSGNHAYGSSGADGGAIGNSGVLTLDNDVFSSNYASNNGGAIDNNAGTVTVSDCTFFENTADTRSPDSGGAVDNENQGTLTVSGSTFTTNYAGLAGGAIENNSGTATLNNDIFNGDNYSSTTGGAIDNQGTLTLTGSILSGNQAATGGGGVNNSGTASVTNSTLSGNLSYTSGGGIGNDSGGVLTLSNSTLSANNSSASGGGIENYSGGMLTVSNSTLSGNVANASGGGIQNASGGELTLTNSTFSGNTAYTSGGGIDNSGTLTVQNSIVSGNATYGTNPDINGTITTDSGNNLLGTAANNSTTDPTPGPGDVFSNAPMLASLGNYGGPTQTLALSTGSPAIAAGNASPTPPATLPVTDQRGLPRLTGGKLDIGAFQTQAPSVVFTMLGQTFLAGQPATISIELEDLGGNPAVAGTGGVTVTLASSSTGGVFLGASGNSLSGSSLTIPQGANSATFEYQDSRTGTPTLIVSAAGLGSASQQETVLPAPISATPSTNIVVGRTLSAYFTGEIQNNQDTITYTVYNESADPESGVLLTDTLAAGVTLLSASQQPDQSGQNLAWSLGTIQAYDWTSVTITVSLSSSSILQLDSGAAAYATLNAGAISSVTSAATLTSGSVDPDLLASTPDANTTDPYVQEEAAALDYNAQNIFNYLHDDIGYNAYSGSLRGARGTLWSSAGNALDVASLGIALMRASGIPAQYVEGTLTYIQADQLVLSMFPASYQTAGYIPAGTQTSDPADDSQLQSETESHYWFQFNAGQGWVNADPLMAGATVGQTFTGATGTFTEVPQSLRQTTEVQLTAEIYSQASAAFVPGGSGLSDTVVLDQTFNDVNLVGAPISIGNFVTDVTTGGLAISARTITYEPYVLLGDFDSAAGSDEVLHGQQYQEILTNFPLGSQILTGLFLNIISSGPGETTSTVQQTLVDRIGYAVRQNGGSPPPINTSGPPVINAQDIYTVNVLAGEIGAGLADRLVPEMNATEDQLTLLSQETQTNPSELLSAAVDLSVYATRDALLNFLALSGPETANLAAISGVVAYFGAPRITIASNVVTAGGPSLTLNLEQDN
ncbi:MAG: choice-of-anchor Q domain-containing protein, partial [Thermoguttaceae bacterium]